MTSSESEGQGGPTRKRSRTSNSAEDGGGKEGKKARGRPRVDTQDATAADVSYFIVYVSPDIFRASTCTVFVLDRAAYNFRLRKTNDIVETKNANTPCATSISAEERNNHLVTQTREHATALYH
jgi:hypothetical protein